MLQIFLKTSAITAQDWERAYRQIVSIAEGFPLRLVRIEAYNGYSPELDKKHFDLRQQVGEPDEHLSFYGDWASFTAGTSVEFYRHWEQQQKLGMSGKVSDERKPVTWAPPRKFEDDGSPPEANGSAIGEHGYIDTRNARYEYALLAIGTMLENLLPGRAFLVPDEKWENADLEKVVEWLEAHFGERFEMPIHFDKPRLLASFEGAYKKKKHAVGRMDQLFRKQFKRNMEFALASISYEPAFAYYAQVLSSTSFGTFGFSDVLDAWIAASQDLESTLRLVAKSKFMLEKKGTERSLEKAAEYDLSKILEKLLRNYILWTPQQREQLAHFHTNQQALETGDEGGIWGSILRMSGHRVDICPFYATADELFEAFMYHDPKNGAAFRRIIDEWLEKNADAYDRLRQKLEEALELPANSPSASLSDDDDEGEDYEGDDEEQDKIESSAAAAFLQNYPQHERFFIAQALKANPGFMRVEELLDDLRKSLQDISRQQENLETVRLLLAEPKAEKIKRIRRRLKELRLSVCPSFEKWLAEEQDDSVLFHLRLLLSLKIYDRQRAFARFRMLFDRGHWEEWREGGRFQV